MHPAHSHGLSLSSFFIFRLKRVAPQIEKRSFDLWRGSKKIVCIRGIMNLTQLRTVPTNEKYFFSQIMTMWDKYIISGAIEFEKENWG